MEQYVQEAVFFASEIDKVIHLQSSKSTTMLLKTLLTTPVASGLLTVQGAAGPVCSGGM